MLYIVITKDCTLHNNFCDKIFFSPGWPSIILGSLNS